MPLLSGTTFATKALDALNRARRVLFVEGMMLLRCSWRCIPPKESVAVTARYVLFRPVWFRVPNSQAGITLYSIRTGIHVQICYADMLTAAYKPTIHSPIQHYDNFPSPPRYNKEVSRGFSYLLGSVLV